VKHHPRRDGQIVELANFPTRLEADAAIGLLEGNDIRAMAKYGDADGWAPHFALLHGYRVCVFDDDLESARALLEADAGLPLPDASDN
jgi:hypothetical protein